MPPASLDAPCGLSQHAIRTRANLPRMFWPPHDEYPYDDSYRTTRDRERLRHLVFLDGRLIETWTEPVEGTAYMAIADELDRANRPVPPVAYTREPPRPPYEVVLDWLDGVVGGRIALLALDDEPFEEAPTTEGDDVDDLLARVADAHFSADFLAATRAALAAVRRDDPDLVAQSPAGEIAAGLCWLVGRANGLVGAGTPVSQKTLKATLWLSTTPTRRVARIKPCLRGLVAEPGLRPPDCPDLLALGSPTYLTAATRKRLIRLRDRALAAAEAADADQHARDTLRPRVDNLSP